MTATVHPLPSITIRLEKQPSLEERLTENYMMYLLKRVVFVKLIVS